jgi:hypothetical protein
MLIREDRSGTKHDLGTVWGCFLLLVKIDFSSRWSGTCDHDNVLYYLWTFHRI